MGATVGQSSNRFRRIAQALKKPALRVGVPIAIAAIITSMVLLSYGMTFEEYFAPFVISLTPYLASAGYGSPFGDNLQAKGWRAMRTQLLGYFALISLLYLPLLILYSSPVRFFPPHAVFGFFAVLSFLHARNLASLDLPKTRRPWLYTRR